MAATQSRKFGVGVYWPDDYTDYLVHFAEPFAVFRVEADREGPVLLWAEPDSDLDALSDLEFSRLLESAERFLVLEGIVESGSGRHAEYRESLCPFPPCLVVSNRSNSLSAVVGMGERPYAAYFNPDEDGPLFRDFDTWFGEAGESAIEEIVRSAEAYYGEFYDRQIILDDQEKARKGRQSKGDPGLHSLN